jgi:hypothetical protein
VCVGCK